MIDPVGRWKEDRLVHGVIMSPPGTFCAICGKPGLCFHQIEPEKSMAEFCDICGDLEPRHIIRIHGEDFNLCKACSNVLRSDPPRAKRERLPWIIWVSLVGCGGMIFITLLGWILR